MVFFVQSLMKFVDGHLETNIPVTKTLQDVCSSSSDELCSCVTREITGWSSRLFTSPRQSKTRRLQHAHSSSKVQRKKVWDFFKTREPSFAQIRRFSKKELKDATNNFSNLVGQGGFGKVYKGKLADGRTVAVKRLYKYSKQGELQFHTELQVSSTAIHRNLIPVFGYSKTGKEKFLVYPFVPKGNLSYHLAASSLEWSMRKKIAIGVARGLAHLHEYCHRRIVHRDVKPDNILLNDKFEPVIGDFGLALLMGNFPFTACLGENTSLAAPTSLDDGDSHITTNICGTSGYLAPEYAMHGRCSEKTDVYAFGIIILQLASGWSRPYKPETENENPWLIEWARELARYEKLDSVADSKLRGEYEKEEMDQMIKVGLLCTNDCDKERPLMSEVIKMLEGVAATPAWNNTLQELSYIEKVIDPSSSSSVLTESNTLTNINSHEILTGADL